MFHKIVPLSLLSCKLLNKFTPVSVNLETDSPVCDAAVANLENSVKAKTGGISFIAVDIISLIVLETFSIPSKKICSPSAIDGFIISKLSAINCPISFFMFSPSGVFNTFTIFVIVSLNSLTDSLAGLLGSAPRRVPID